VESLIIVAHPDDETLGAGILLSYLKSPKLLHVTDGAPVAPLFLPSTFKGSSTSYAVQRRQELAAAMAVVGVEEVSLQCLRVPDTQVTLTLPYLARRIADLISELRPELVITHAYEGGHPDHDATVFAVHAAMELRCRSGLPLPRVLEMALYHAQPGVGSLGPRPVTGFLPEPPSSKVVQTIDLDLTRTERELKQRMLDCFASQRTLLRWLPRTFRESFRRAPEYDFTRPPHAGPLLYELAEFPITGDRWRSLARQARRELGFS
jgi:LmbE family N-acetylglucosaminyl deacetylase